MLIWLTHTRMYWHTGSTGRAPGAVRVNRGRWSNTCGARVSDANTHKLARRINRASNSSRLIRLVMARPSRS